MNQNRSVRKWYKNANSIKTKNKLVLYLIEEHERIVKERDKYIQLSEKSNTELSTLKSAVKNKIDADHYLIDLVSK